jgi:starvation-inducible DNA-binding protein
MYPSRIDLSVDIRRELIELLQARLSDSLDLEAQTKQAHWNVRGTDFFQLHELFDRVHDSVEELVDLLAERLTTLGGIADGRIQTTGSSSKLPVYPIAAYEGSTHISALADALGVFAALARSAIDRSTKLEDAVTADLFTEVARTTDKQLWLVEAHTARTARDV